jgi:hypothetical protein
LIDCGYETPQLQEISIIILSQPCRASGCEHNWLVFEYIHTKRHNRLEHEQLEKLVFIYYNLQMFTKHLWAKDLDPILLDKIDLVSNWVLEDESFTDDLSWLDEETRDLSNVPFSQLETPDTPAS